MPLFLNLETNTSVSDIATIITYPLVASKNVGRSEFFFNSMCDLVVCNYYFLLALKIDIRVGTKTIFFLAASSFIKKIGETDITKIKIKTSQVAIILFVLIQYSYTKKIQSNFLNLIYIVALDSQSTL